MRSLMDLLPARRRPAADPRVVSALQDYIGKLVEVLDTNCRNNRVSLQSDVEHAEGRPQDIAVALVGTTRLRLQVVGLMASQYDAALREVELPAGVELVGPEHNKRVQEVICMLNCTQLLRERRIEMLDSRH